MSDSSTEIARRQLQAMTSIVDALEPLESDAKRLRVLAAVWCLQDESGAAANAALFTLRNVSKDGG